MTFFAWAVCFHITDHVIFSIELFFYPSKNISSYYIKVSGIASGNKLMKTIRYPHM